jgi:hypothetical protein
MLRTERESPGPNHGEDVNCLGISRTWALPRAVSRTRPCLSSSTRRSPSSVQVPRRNARDKGFAGAYPNLTRRSFPAHRGHTSADPWPRSPSPATPSAEPDTACRRTSRLAGVRLGNAWGTPRFPDLASNCVAPGGGQIAEVAIREQVRTRPKPREFTHAARGYCSDLVPESSAADGLHTLRRNL